MKAARRLPQAGVLLAAIGGAATVLFAIWLFVGSSEAPARAPRAGHISAGTGQLAVLDGDTLRLGEQVVRLAGVAAPARGSLCQGDGSEQLDCGSAAANALSALIRGKAVDCAIGGHDGEGRPKGDCTAAGRSLNIALVRDGWARADIPALRESEDAARAAGLGIWRRGIPK